MYIGVLGLFSISDWVVGLLQQKKNWGADLGFPPRFSLSIARQILTRPMQGLNAIIVNSAAEKR